MPFGVTVSKVLGVLPFAEGTVNSESRGLNTRVLTDWITEGANQLTAALTSVGVASEDMPDPDRATLSSGVIAYAAMRAAMKRDFPAEDIDRFRDEWEAAKRFCREYKGGLGGSDASLVTSNTSGTERRFKEKWNGF
jgi:hypothetical protein